ncbi:MAG: ATP-binding cassette domain-containing protein [Acidimicrobiales bacterium]
MPPDSLLRSRPGDDGDIAIAGEGLVRTFDESTAVDRLDLQVRRGEIYGFLGPNGAGKSTTVRMLCTLLRPSAGRATVCGHDVTTQAGRVRTSIGVALQDVALDPKQTGTELLRLQARLYGLTRAETDLRLAELATIVELGDALDRRVGTYSGGMRRRLDLAAALVHNPEVLFLDEPTTGLDPASRTRVWDEVSRLNSELGMTIFLTTQYLEEADALADRVGIIDGGRLVAEGTPTDLKRTIGQDVIVVRVAGDHEVAAGALREIPEVDAVDHRHDELVVSVATGSSSIGPVAVALDHAGVAVRDLTLRTPTLDDVFLDLTGSRINTGAGDDPAASADPPADTRPDPSTDMPADALEAVR